MLVNEKCKREGTIERAQDYVWLKLVRKLIGKKEEQNGRNGNLYRAIDIVLRKGV